ncbi:hypothetical protein EVAR_100664_1 [Eumeta japonica]|uniref:Uncharacterized protein n=1 Tax=Eumeta variegata TaxID=151549 RepID=A0A4C1ZMH0_EUMVA|nr:hypothetical protein EVAR_100664_1 [Eumeta japonica]
MDTRYHQMSWKARNVYQESDNSQIGLIAVLFLKARNLRRQPHGAGATRAAKTHRIRSQSALSFLRRASAGAPDQRRRRARRVPRPQHVVIGNAVFIRQNVGRPRHALARVPSSSARAVLIPLTALMITGAARELAERRPALR